MSASLGAGVDFERSRSAERLSECEAVVEIRKVMDVEDFGDGFTPNPDIAKLKIK